MINIFSNKAIWFHQDITFSAKVLHNLYVQGVTVDFPPSKLKAGFGEHVIFVLDRLADFALKTASFAWKK